MDKKLKLIGTKKYFLPILLIFTMILAGCSDKSSNNTQADEDTSTVSNTETNADADNGNDANGNTSDVTEITENLFSQQIDYIYYNPDDYIGQSITYEGIYDVVESGYTDEDIEYLPCVFRYGPGGCCGNDSLVGFEIIWNGETPSPNDWVKVTGDVEYVEHWGMQYLALNVTSLDILSERGEEYVT